MATKLEPDYASSPTNDDSDGESDNSTDSIYQEEIKPPTNNVADILKRLQSSGALIKKPKQEYRCFTCNEDYRNWEELENHLIQHVSLPSVVLEKLPSDDEDIPPSEDENWTDEEESSPQVKSSPQKIDISQILKKTGVSIKKSNPEPEKSNLALSKLSGLGFTIKKNTIIKKEPDAESDKSDVMQKLGNLGGIKLKLKSSGNNTNTFKVINGLKDFKASDEEDEGSGNDEAPEGDEEDHKSSDQDGSGGDNDSGDEQTGNQKKSESNDSDTLSSNRIMHSSNSLKNLQGKTISKVEPMKISMKSVQQSVIKEMPALKPSGRPVVKQTPKRGANLPIPRRKSPTPTKEVIPTKTPTPPMPDKIEPQNVIVENVTVKKEVETGELQLTSIPMFSGQIKSERTSPPPAVTSSDGKSTPMLTAVKSDPDSNFQPIISSNSFSPAQSNNTTSSTLSTSTNSLYPVSKVEETQVIEINGDSNDEDDDCCVVSATPAPDIKPIVPKSENPPRTYLPPTFTTPQSSYSTSSVLSSRLSSVHSLEKQHNFNWNAPDSKPAIDMLEKSADDIFESLLSTSTKKENLSLSEASEYISLDTLGPQHSCDICNTRFTDLSLLDEHKRMTGHSRSLVAPSSSTLVPYNPTSNILSSLLPVKQIADQVGKLSGIGSGPGFTHQQNVMINIQAYPGAGGVMGPPPPYNNYPSGQNMNPGYPQGQNNMYGPQGASQMPGQYTGQHFMGPQGYGQFATSMNNSNYPGSSPQFSTPSSQYSNTSPLQSMQQTVFGQGPAGIGNVQGQMGPPGSPYVPSSSPGGSMKSPNNSGVRIQNVQTFPPGQLLGMPGQPVSVSSEMPSQPVAPGQIVGGQMPPPNQIRMSAGVISGPRPRLPNIRGQRPSIRPGIQVHGQVRGAKPGMRMPMKRPANMPTGVGHNAKKRPSMLLPDKHDNEDCTVMAMQKQREGLPLIHSVQGAKDKINLGSQISITKKTVNKEANAMANVLASRGISIKQKQKSRSPTPERPLPHIPNLGAGVSIKHTSKSSNFSIPEAKVGGGMLSCKICKKMFMNQNSLSVHMTNAHPQHKVPLFKCDECPASYPKSLQLQHHKRVFHNVTGPNRELGLPVVDLAQEENLKRLSSLGIYSFIPLANREQAGGCFGIPVISVHNMNNGMTTSLQALGADGLLSLGPLKPLPKP